MREIINKISRELGLPKQVVLNTYKAYWLYIRQEASKMPFKEDLTEEEFIKLEPHFNVPNLGKLCCPYERYLGIKTKLDSNDKHKENQANG